MTLVLDHLCCVKNTTIANKRRPLPSRVCRTCRNDKQVMRILTERAA